MTDGDPDRRAGHAKPEGREQRPPTFDTSTLFGTKREVILVHKGEPYRLRQTQSGKLILTK
ncbi:hemin uptake protein HemP [Enterovirga sp.]|uniref:hemin uptake protein HemP n=1 Tax=Enterovirga sp. TaxID=2026350 RepID=UPI002C5913A2|nr:hemin uptake protein HemP [Enterovirga sp.]HMO28604.1 hemin uptake protein HemP [Enterovirga sp.]